MTTQNQDTQANLYLVLPVLCMYVCMYDYIAGYGQDLPCHQCDNVTSGQ